VSNIVRRYFVHYCLPVIYLCHYCKAYIRR